MVILPSVAALEPRETALAPMVVVVVAVAEVAEDSTMPRTRLVLVDKVLQLTV